MRFLLIAALILFSASQLASQPGQSSEQAGKGGAEQKPASAFEGAGKPFPFWFAPQPQVIQIVSEKKAEANCKAPSEYASLEWLSYSFCEVWAYPEVSTAIATIILAVGTFCLAISTQIAASAAKTAARHIPTVERAYMFGGPTRFRTVFDQPKGTVRIHVSVKNHGKTPGILVEAYGEFLPEPPKRLPAHYAFTAGKKWEFDNVFSNGEVRVLENEPFEGGQISRHSFHRLHKI